MFRSLTVGRRLAAALGATVVCTASLLVTSSLPAAASVSILGSGSSFAGPEVLQWATDVAKAPYNLTVNFTSSSSGDGRFAFAGQTVDFAVSDIPYQSYPFDTKSPTFPFIYVPVTAGGLAFMYHLNGLSKTLQLSSYSACAIFTGAVTMWNDPVIAADNPGVNLPAVAIHPVTRSDLSGTNFVFQEYCIHEQGSLWSAFANSPIVKQYPGQVSDLSATSPRSDWPLFTNSIPVSGSSTAADTVASSNANGYITAVETEYAIQRNVPVASVKNASGDYTQPTAVDVASGLAYATQQSNGTHELNFDGTGPHVYNPSTYSYALVPTANTAAFNAQKGATLTAFLNYALTIGQQRATEIGYASLGLSLERYGVDAIKGTVPGAVQVTTDEANAYSCGDLTVPDVQAGRTTATCGAINSNTLTTAPGGAVVSAGGSAGSRTAGGARAGGAGRGGATAADPAVSLSGNPALAFTGANPAPIIGTGIVLVIAGVIGRRRIGRARPPGYQS